MRDRYTSGGVAYKEMKEALHAVLIKRFGPARERYLDLVADPQTIFRQLDYGGANARETAQHVLAQVRQAVGTGKSSDHRV